MDWQWKADDSSLPLKSLICFSFLFHLAITSIRIFWLEMYIKRWDQTDQIYIVVSFMNLVCLICYLKNLFTVISNMIYPKWNLQHFTVRSLNFMIHKCKETSYESPNYEHEWQEYQPIKTYDRLLRSMQYPRVKWPELSSFVFLYNVFIRLNQKCIGMNVDCLFLENWNSRKFYAHF